MARYQDSTELCLIVFCVLFVGSFGADRAFMSCKSVIFVLSKVVNPTTKIIET